MATNRDLLKEAIADAKAVKETAIANAKAALEEAFTPFLKEKLAAKINEMDEEMDEEMYDEAEEMNEMEEMDEVSLDELLAELDNEDENMMNEEAEEEDESLYEAKEAEEEEEMSIEDMSEEDLKSFIEDVIKDMVSAGELEAGHEGMENEEGAEEEGEEEGEEEEGGEEELDEEINLDELLAEAEEEELEERSSYKKPAKDPSPKSDNAIFSKGKGGYVTDKTEDDDAPYSSEKAEKISFHEDEQLDEILSDVYVSNPEALAAAITVGSIPLAIAVSVWGPEIKNAIKKGKDAVVNFFKGKKSDEIKEAYETIETLKSELHEINLLNAKLLYTNKIFRNKSLTESQKIKVLTAFDKATSKKEVELVYETLQESLKVSTTKAPIKESLGSASKVLGNASAKPIIEVDSQFARWQQLAGINKK